MALLCRPPGMEIVRPAASEVREGRKSFENRAIAQGPLQEDSADAAAATDSKDDKDTTAMSVTMGASCFSPRHAPQLDSLEDLAKADPDAPARAPSEVPGVTEQLGSLANLVGDDERPWGDEPSLPGPPPILVEDEQTTSALGLALSMVPASLADDAREGRAREGRAREGRRSFVERAIQDAAVPADSGTGVASSRPPSADRPRAASRPPSGSRSGSVPRPRSAQRASSLTSEMT